MYAQVIVPVPLNTTFTYRVPENFSDFVKPYTRVVVPFGRGKFYTGIVTETFETFNGDYEIKDIIWCDTKGPILKRPQLELWQWMANYYMCTLGDVLKAVLPSGLKLESETFIEINPEFEASPEEQFSPEAMRIYEILLGNEKPMSTSEIEKKSPETPVMKAIYSLMESGAVVVREKISERFKPKNEEYYRLVIDRENPEILQSVFKNLRSERHQKLLMTLIHLSDFTRKNLPLKEVSRESLKDIEAFDRYIIKSFEKKQFLEIISRRVSRFIWTPVSLKPLPQLSPAQHQALETIHKSFISHPTVLLHGVTSSGKTEIFMHLIDFVLKQKKQVLYLVPEIALTTQLTQRLQAIFGEKVIIYHSRFSDSERGEIWLRLLHEGKPAVIIGARSSVFLPFTNLGLVIVDEEHEQSYKQFDPAPRYNARDVAAVLARLHGAKTLLASATPAVETFYKASTNKYGLVSLNERYGNVKLPDIEIIDMNKARAKGETVGSLSTKVISATRHAIAEGRQAIFFHNRRGFSPFAQCSACQYIPKCSDCDVSLTYHKAINRLVCHYCGREYALSPVCPVCQEPKINIRGYGTERVEEDVSEQFGDTSVLRMDLDTTRNKDNYSSIIHDFSNNKANILIGTQMVTKGLDFHNVSTVVVLNADLIINYPDFRSTERAFNMLEQVSGRAGRRQESEGHVYIQTHQPEHPVLFHVLKHDYLAFYNDELSAREAFAYPPFVRLIYVFIRHKDEQTVINASESLSAALTTKLGNRVLGPHQPSVSRIKTMHIRRLMIKVEPSVSISQVKEILNKSSIELRTQAAFRAVDIYFDVDPM